MIAGIPAVVYASVDIIRDKYIYSCLAEIQGLARIRRSRVGTRDDVPVFTCVLCFKIITIIQQYTSVYNLVFN